MMAVSLKKYVPAKNAAILEYMKHPGRFLQTPQDWFNFRILLMGLPEAALPDLRRHLVDTYILEHLESTNLLYWNNYHRDLRPLKTTSDGNCLLHASLSAILGVEDEGGFLRTKLHEILTGELGEEFKRRWLIEQDNMQNHYAQLDMASFRGFDQNREQEWTEILQSLHPDAPPVPGGLRYQSLEEIHVFALAHLLRSPIIVVAANTVKSAMSGEDLAPCFFGGVYLPLLLPPETCTRIPLLLAYHEMHFVPLVPITETDADSLFVLTSPSLEPLKMHCTTYEENSSLHVLLDHYLNIEQLDVNTVGTTDSKEGKFRLPGVKLLSKPIPPQLNITNSYIDKLWERHGQECAYGDCRLFATRTTAPYCESHSKRRKMDDDSESRQSGDHPASTDEGNARSALSAITASVGKERRPPSGKSKSWPVAAMQPQGISQKMEDIPESPGSSSDENNEMQPVPHKHSKKASSFPQKKPLHYSSGSQVRMPWPPTFVSKVPLAQPPPTRSTTEFREPVAIPPKLKLTRVEAMKADEPSIPNKCQHPGCQRLVREARFCIVHKPETSTPTFPKTTMTFKRCLSLGCKKTGFVDFKGFCHEHKHVPELPEHKISSMPPMKITFEQCHHPTCSRAKAIGDYCINHVPDSDSDDDITAHEPGPSSGTAAPASGSFVSGGSFGTPSYEELVQFQEASHRDRPRCRRAGCNNYASRGGYCNGCNPP